MINKAIEKIEKEAKEFNGDRKAGAVSGGVKDALITFIRQSEEFAELVYKDSLTFGECCKNVVKDCGNSIADLEAYRRAVKFYMPDADISFEMKLCMPSSGTKNKKTLSFSLESFI